MLLNFLELLKAPLSWLIVAILGAWVVITAFNQTSRTRRLIGRLVAYDICGLIPVWTFFAPNPGDTDTHLLFRDRDPEGRMTDWREVRMVSRRRVIDLWNPRRRISKSLVDVVYDLTKRDKAQGEQGPQLLSKRRVLSFPYLLVLNYVSQHRGDFGAFDRQFVIAKTPGIASRGRPEVLFVSPFHRLR